MTAAELRLAAFADSYAQRGDGDSCGQTYDKRYLVMDIGSSLLFLMSMVAVFAWFWFMSQPSQLRRVAESRRGSRWLTRNRSVEEDAEYMRKFMRYVNLPFAGLCVAIALVTFIRSLVMSL